MVINRKENGVKSGMASLTFIANKLGLSKATVSRAFDPRFSDMVKAETKERIFNFCKEHNYHPSMIGRSFSTGKTFKIGFITARAPHRSFSLFAAAFSNAIADAAMVRGYTPVMLNPDKNSASFIDQINSSVADAYIINNSNRNEEFKQLLSSKNIPAILYDPYDTPPHELPVLYRDIKPAYRELWQNLPQKYWNDTAFIWRGFVPGKWRDLRSAAPEGVTVGNIRISDKKENFLFHRDSARDGAEKIIDQLVKYKLLWCSSDLVALGICDALKAHGVEPGKDIYVVGFDNLAQTLEDFPDNRLTTIDPCWKQGGKMLVNMLLDSIEYGTPIGPRTPWISEVIYNETFKKVTTNVQ